MKDFLIAEVMIKTEKLESVTEEGIQKYNIQNKTYKEESRLFLTSSTELRSMPSP